MDWLLALLVGLVGGLPLGAMLTVSHERAERFRDRQFEAASRFVADYEAALDALLALWDAVIDIRDTRNRVEDAVGPAQEAGTPEQVGADVLFELAKAQRVGVDLIGRDARSQRARDGIARSSGLVEQAIENLSGSLEEPFASANVELLRSMQEARDALARYSEAAQPSRLTIHRLLVRVAQLNLLFANDDAEVVEAARQVAESLVLLGGRVLGIRTWGKDEPQEESDDPEAISDDVQNTNQLLADFAALANARVRPRPLRPWRGHSWLVRNLSATDSAVCADSLSPGSSGDIPARWPRLGATEPR